MTRDALPSLCTAAQGCRYLGIGRSTWARWEQQGTLPTRRIPGLPVVRYDGEALKAIGTKADIAKRTREAMQEVA